MTSACDGQDLAPDAAVEALDHAVGFGRVGFGLAVVDAQVAAGRLEAVGGEAAAVISNTWVTLKGKAATASLRKAERSLRFPRP